jgi:hypothetical protein
MILAEQVAANVNWSLICNLVLALTGILMWLDSRKVKATTISPQPIVIQEQKEFVNKNEFQTVAAGNTERHAQLCQAIEKVEREARAALTTEVNKIQTDRQRTMEKLNEHFSSSANRSAPSTPSSN